jgi:hypothetical protein
VFTILTVHLRVLHKPQTCKAALVPGPNLIEGFQHSVTGTLEHSKHLLIYI